MKLNEIKTLLVGTIKTAFANKKTLDKFEETNGTLKYNGVPVNNLPVFVADDAPIGNIISFMGNNAPKDYLICDGSEYNIADYPLLVQHFVDEFGSANYFGGDGENTFCVPDLRGEFLRGTGTATRNTGSGSAVGKHQDATSHLWIANYSDGVLQTHPPTANSAMQSSNHDTTVQASGYFRNFKCDIPGTESYNKPSTYTSRPTNTSVLYCIKYQITQNNITKDMVNYSLEEQVIGSWINGKPLYQKTFSTTIPTYNSDKSFTPVLTIENIESMVNYKGFYIANNDTVVLPYASGEYNGNTSGGFHCSLFQRNNQIMMTQGFSNISGKSLYITMQYTKTTDAENSFTPDMLSNIKALDTVATEEEVSEVLGGI